MRSRTAEQPYLPLSRESSLQVVNEYRERYRAVDALLRRNPELLDRVHRRLSRFLSTSRKGRRSAYTSDQILRALLVMFLEGDSYRDVVVRIEESPFLREFVGLGWQPMMDFTFLSRAFGVLDEALWRDLNTTLAVDALFEGKISGEQLRVDTTVVETSIHYPTESSLLWDGYRVLARLLRLARAERPDSFSFRLHDGKVKRLAQTIARGAGSRKKSTQRKIKRTYTTLLERVGRVVDLAEAVAARLDPLFPVRDELLHFSALTRRVIKQTEARVFEGRHLPAAEKVCSLFEEHTELIKRGKAGKSVEFGHTVLLGQTKEKFISQYQVMPRQIDETALVDDLLAEHKGLFNRLPSALAADKGFYESMDKIAQLEKAIPVVSIAKKGKRDRAQAAREAGESFKAGQRFRAGIEGSISVLKRAFKLSRCLFKGFRNYASAVGCAIFCYNLIVLTRL